MVKILIVSVKAGAGHLKAAEALEEACSRYEPEIEAKNMAASNLLITKPGGITVSESIAMGLPMIFVEPIPGQEEANADFIVEQGAGVKARSLPALIYKVDGFMKNRGKLAHMSKKAKEICRPYAARKIVREVMGLGSHRRL